MLRFHETANPVLLRAADKNVKAGKVAQDIVCATADDDGVSLGGDGADDLALCLEEDVFVHIGAVHVAHAARGKETGSRENAPLLFPAGKQVFRIAAFLGGLGNELVVVERDAQFLGNGLAHETAAAAKAAAHIDDGMLHIVCHSLYLAAQDRRIVAVFHLAQFL